MSAPDCVETSHWGGELGADEAASMKAAGIGMVIVASGPGNHGRFARQQAETILAACRRLEAYTFLAFESDPKWWVRQARPARRAPGRPLVARRRGHGAREVLDTGTARRLRSTRARGLRCSRCLRSHRQGWLALAAAHGQYGGFRAPGPQALERLVRRRPDVDGLPYGGWTVADVAVEQFEGTSLVCGQSVDKNRLCLPEVGEEIDLRARMERLERLIGSNRAGNEEWRRPGGEETLAWMGGEDFSLLLGLANTQEAMAALAPVGKHEHAASVEVRLS